MAYENYNYISWSDGSPLSSNRLEQMSINIEQVKDVVDDKAQGLIKLNQVTQLVPNSTGYSGFTEYTIIALKNESGTGGPDRRVSIEKDRYYRVGVSIPAISILNRGAEDTTYVINIYDGEDTDPEPLKIASWQTTPSVYTFINVATDANANVQTVKTTTYPTKIAAGTYSVIKSTTEAITNKSFYASIVRNTGIGGANNAPNWRVEANTFAPIQIFVEDIGGL